jgi:membrane protein
VAFYGLLAIFPGLVALVATYGLFADPVRIERHVASLSAILPPGAAQVVMTQLCHLVATDRTALGLGAIGGLQLAPWSASAAVRTLMDALNVPMPRKSDAADSLLRNGNNHRTYDSELVERAA